MLFGLAWFGVFSLESVWLGNGWLGKVLLEIARLGFSLVQLSLFWFGLLPCFKKWRGKYRRVENIWGKDQAEKRPSGEKT